MEREGAVQQALRRAGKFLATPVVSILAAFGVTPTQITVVGVLAAIPGGVALAFGLFEPALWFCLISAACDWLDGALARASKLTSAVGRFVDQVSDRVTDVILFGSAVAYYGLSHSLIGTAASMAALTAAVVVPYVKARAEELELQLDGGFMTRAPRTMLFLVGVWFGPLWLQSIMIVIAVGGFVTAVQRVNAVLKHLRKAV